jgi:DNA invertase Pin-like site-specific DNA recombinase
VAGEVQDGGSERGRLIGYVSGSGTARTAKIELDRQAQLIDRECERRGFQLVELVYELEPANRRSSTRPGLAYALRRISEQTASGLIVAELRRLTRSAVELGQIIDWLGHHKARLAAATEGLDTAASEGRLAAALLVSVAGWERARLSERTRNGLMAAKSNGRSIGRPAVGDDPALSQRIREMRIAGMTLQAIADRLNEEGVPTIRGGSLWRHSSVQVAAGYRRRPRRSPILPTDDSDWADDVSRESRSPA